MIRSFSSSASKSTVKSKSKSKPQPKSIKPKQSKQIENEKTKSISRKTQKKQQMQQQQPELQEKKAQQQQEESSIRTNPMPFSPPLLYRRLLKSFLNFPFLPPRDFTINPALSSFSQSILDSSFHIRNARLAQKLRDQQQQQNNSNNEIENQQQLVRYPLRETSRMILDGYFRRNQSEFSNSAIRTGEPLRRAAFFAHFHSLLRHQFSSSSNKKNQQKKHSVNVSAPVDDSTNQDSIEFARLAAWTLEKVSSEKAKTPEIAAVLFAGLSGFGNRVYSEKLLDCFEKVARAKMQK